MTKRAIGAILLVASLILALGVMYRNSQRRQIPLVFSPQLMLNSLWQHYKSNFWEAETGRTLDPQRGNITTSEGQSYTLLRAVWQDDKKTFDKTWQWTKENLQRKEDNLFSWLYGSRSDGTVGILTERNGMNSASDGDTDIALALLLAHARWQDESYLQEAKKIIGDIWNHEVVEINGRLYLAANNLEKNSPDKAILNPSYFAPYAYRLFAAVDASHDWSEIVDTSYAVIEQALADPLDKNVSAGLPPDWIVLDKRTGKPQASAAADLTTNFSYDAFRLPWRLALDYAWYGSARAKETLAGLSFLSEQWQQAGLLYAGYSHDGRPISQAETPAMYGATLGYFLVSRPDIAGQIYFNKLQFLYNPDAQNWKHRLSYYEDNWAWFGLALYHNSLPNLAASLTASSQAAAADSTINPQ